VIVHADSDVLAPEDISRAILVLRRQRVILDRDLAALYGVTTTRLNEGVKRKARRFPPDFMFRLSTDEHAALMSQFATSKPGRGGHRKLPLAFTEHGAIQAANVLNNRRAVEVGVHVVRAFVRLRELLATNKNLDARRRTDTRFRQRRRVVRSVRVLGSDAGKS
jgi:hypothetical protein